MRKVGVVMVMASFVSSAGSAAAAEPDFVCLWRNTLAFLEIRTPASLGLTTITGRSLSALGAPTVCTNALCLSEDRPILLHGTLDLIRPIFDPAIQAGLYVGQVVYRGRIATMEIPTTLATLKILFADGSQEVFSQFLGCQIPGAV
jgi:hypothetical protein